MIAIVPDPVTGAAILAHPARPVIAIILDPVTGAVILAHPAWPMIAIVPDPVTGAATMIPALPVLQVPAVRPVIVIILDPVTGATTVLRELLLDLRLFQGSLQAPFTCVSPHRNLTAVQSNYVKLWSLTCMIWLKSYGLLRAVAGRHPLCRRALAMTTLAPQMLLRE